MAPPLYLTTIITGLVFFLGLLIMRRNKKSPITAVFSGGSFWFLAGLIQLIILLFIYLIEPRFELGLTSELPNYISAVVDYRTLLFWYIFVATIASEAMRFIGSQSDNFSPKNHISFALFGLGWGIAEFSTRFLGFFNENESVVYYVFIFLMYLLMNIFLSMLMIRVNENTRFVMFAVFNKFFFELAIFGVFGYENPLPEEFGTLWLIVFFSILMISLSIYTKNYEFEE